MEEIWKKNPFSILIVTILLISLVLEYSEGYQSGPPDHRNPIQTAHENDPVPADYPHQDEQFSGPAGSFSGSLRPATSGQGQSKLKDIRTESAHEIFLSDRVVRTVCKSLSTFASTGVITKGRAKRLSPENAWESRCGWWKSVTCGSGSNDGTCGFQWLDCKEVNSGKPSDGTPVELEDLGPLRDIENERRSGVAAAAAPAAASEPLGQPGDESELNLHLPPPGEWERRLNLSLTADNKDDD